MILDFKVEPFNLINYERSYRMLEGNKEESSPIPWELDIDVASYRGSLTLYIEAHGRMVGYCIARLMNHPHYNKKVAYIDVFYVHPDYRGATSFRFMNDIEKYLRDFEGVKGILQSTTTKKDISKLLTRKGYEKVEEIYFKRL